MMNVASAMHSLNLCKWYNRSDRSWYALMMSLVISLDFFVNNLIVAFIPFNWITNEFSFWLSAFKRRISLWTLVNPFNFDAPGTASGCRSNTKCPTVLCAHFFGTNSILIDFQVDANKRMASFSCQLVLLVRQVNQRRALDATNLINTSVADGNERLVESSKNIFFFFSKCQNYFHFADACSFVLSE